MWPCSGGGRLASLSSAPRVLRRRSSQHAGRRARRWQEVGCAQATPRVLRVLHASFVAETWAPGDRAGQEHGGHMLREQRVHGGGPVRGRSLCPRGRWHGDLPWLPSLRAALMSPRGPPGPPWWHSVPSGSPGAPAGLPADCRGRWESFVEETLTETNRRNAVDLVSGAGRPLGPRPSRQPQHAWPGAGLTPTHSAVAGEHPPPSSLERGRGHGGCFP